jgi:hypothetical protein
MKLRLYLATLLVAVVAACSTTAPNTAEYGAAESLAAVVKTTDQLLLAGQITKPQAQSIATQTKAIQASIVAASETAKAGGSTSAQWAAIATSIAALQAYLTSIPAH